MDRLIHFCINLQSVTTLKTLNTGIAGKFSNFADSLLSNTILDFISI